MKWLGRLVTRVHVEEIERKLAILDMRLAVLRANADRVEGSLAKIEADIIVLTAQVERESETHDD